MQQDSSVTVDLHTNVCDIKARPRSKTLQSLLTCIQMCVTFRLCSNSSVAVDLHTNVCDIKTVQQDPSVAIDLDTNVCDIKTKLRSKTLWLLLTYTCVTLRLCSKTLQSLF